jgi:CheY-like chemotaxis protein
MRRDVPILVVEDDVLDVKNIRRSFAENRVVNPLYFVKDGEQAMAYLKREPPYDGPGLAPRPGLILLDLNLPRMNGISFLERYKSDAELCSIPAVVLTTSNEESDRAKTYELGIAGYIVKPVQFPKFIEAIKRFDLYWSICEVPNE